MYAKLATVALMGLSTLASAQPLAAASGSTTLATSVNTKNAAVATQSSAGAVSPHGTGKAEVKAQSTASAAKVKGEVFKYPLANGFPNIKVPSAQLNKIEKQAHGTLPGPNGAPPTGLHPDTINSVGFVAFNELFEVAFFSELIANVTAGGPGFNKIADKEMVLANLKVILAQEELHELANNGIFNANSGKKIQPCKYQFPVDNFNDAIALASKFTDVVLSTLPDIQQIAATEDDVAIVGAVGSVIGQEGEQNGFFRGILGENPSQLPFLTGGARNFAFNAILQNFVVPGSCPSLGLLENPSSGVGLNETGILNVLSTDLSIEQDTVAKFSVQTVVPSNTHSYYVAHGKGANMNFVTYLNQKNTPVSVPIQKSSISFEGDAITFKAQFPGKTDFLEGLTIAAVTKTKGFTSPDEVAADTQFGPGLIEID